MSESRPKPGVLITQVSKADMLWFADLFGCDCVAKQKQDPEADEEDAPAYSAGVFQRLPTPLF